MPTSTILGVDIGSVSVALVEVDRNRQVLRWEYRSHEGKVARTLGDIISEWTVDQPAGLVRIVAATSSSPRILQATYRADWITSHVAAHRVIKPDHQLLLIIGGERFALIQFDRDGHYQSSRGNSGCAAGTGGFLDQQAQRLGLRDAGELGKLASENTGALPKVASRCAVFAKTDLIHAQQEGYSLPEICDGLCHGLARNLVDAVITGTPPAGGLSIAGGVALNYAVVTHVSALLAREAFVHELAPAYGAYGAALSALEERAPEAESPIDLTDLVTTNVGERTYFYKPLTKPTGYPDFTSHERFVMSADLVGGPEVEVDRYVPATAEAAPEQFFLGADIGSTSTKTVLIDPEGTVHWAFYTRTAGKPLAAIRSLFEVMQETGAVTAPIAGAACTGSGRKFVGGVIGADLVLDEITAHARAATELDPDTDTIIEIGGQDAKFTTLKNGRVTFSQMNTVCAAGTGSFLEEQAHRLKVPLTDYAVRAMDSPAPLTSDRCTVFMERDINHYLNKGFATSEILAAALHSVRENYLQKVAHRSAIGSHVAFQGATAKNRGLVAAFEEQLGQSITVSRYCHVTGALGAALVCRDEITKPSTFRGIGIYRSDIPVRSERCTLCTNNCRLTIADIGGEQVAYGFLCGRDYSTPTFVSANRSGFDLIDQRKKLERRVAKAPRALRPKRRIDKVIGIPTGLHLAEERPFWERVFAELGIPTTTTLGYADAVRVGKQLEGAEFCSPVAAFHGHVSYLLDHADLVFVPLVLETEYTGEHKLAYCYYTQFTPSVLAGILRDEDRDRLLMPVLWGPGRDAAGELRRVFEPYCDLPVSEIRGAFRRAREAQERSRHELQKIFADERVRDDVNVVLLGRPYTAVDPTMNKGIPDIIGRIGIRAFYQDMLPQGLPSEDTGKLLESVHWRYAADILLGADIAARTPGLYPVFITSFRCAPDSFCVDAFNRIMDARDKPYLILEIDEHDSSVGYETRIEAALRAFKNHHQAGARRSIQLGSITRQSDVEVAPDLEKAIGDKTLLLPAWDPITTPLQAANLRANGINAVSLTETPLSIQKSMRLNSGQCIPVSAVAQEAMDYVRENDLDPADTVLWMGRSRWTCGIPLYPRFLKGLFAQEGLSDLGVYVGHFAYLDISSAASVGAYFAYQFGGWLRRIMCRIRPYEINPGQTDEIVAEWRDRLVTVFEGKENRYEALRAMVAAFDAIPRREEKRPKVAIFGDLYVRDNDVMNQDLIRRIEETGGEAVTTPYSDYAKIIVGPNFGRLWRRREYMLLAKQRLVLAAVGQLERRYQREVAHYVGPPVEWRRPGLEEDLRKFGMVIEQEGESYENALKILHLISRYPDLALFVQTSPAFCCPSLVTEALSSAIERIAGVPIVTVTYDGTGGDKNAVVVPYIKFPRSAKTA
ncbi:MAG: acyl-CoA dehydratase activase [Spirochaetia bacterium]